MDILLIRKLANEVPCDPRSVAKRVRGEKVRGLLGQRIDAVLRKHRVKVQQAPRETSVDRGAA